MLVTAETSHFDKSWLKADAPENMNPIFKTAATSHFDRSWLKADAPANRSSMSVMADTSQSAIGPYNKESPLGDSLMHSLTAVLSVSLDSGRNAAAVVRV